jgi:putative aminopeptidase FrvX
MNQREQDLLFDLLHLPTAPFRETQVVGFVAKKLQRARVPFFFDPSGNIVVGAASAGEYKKLLRRAEREPLRFFVAHMDHPGFHGVRWLSDSQLEVTWHGGAPVKGLHGAPVWLSDQNGYAALGHMTHPRLDKKRKRLLAARVQITRNAWLLRPPAQRLFGGFGERAPVWRDGKLFYTKAADDLVGVFAIVRTAIQLFRGGRRPPFIGLLTRGEEVGFIGMLAHLEQGWLQRAKRNVVCVSLETSRTLPGADIGKGPVVRLGDRRTVFNPGYLRVLAEVAEKVLPKRHQRRIMDGGTCEATAALAYDLPAIGISVPLGNYHNESYEGRTRGRPAPEYVHRDDVAGLLVLCEGLMRPGLPWDAPWENTRRALRRNFRQQRRLLGNAKRNSRR